VVSVIMASASVWSQEFFFSAVDAKRVFFLFRGGNYMGPVFRGSDWCDRPLPGFPFIGRIWEWIMCLSWRRGPNPCNVWTGFMVKGRFCERKMSSQGCTNAWTKQSFSPDSAVTHNCSRMDQQPRLARRINPCSRFSRFSAGP